MKRTPSNSFYSFWKYYFNQYLKLITFFLKYFSCYSFILMSFYRYTVNIHPVWFYHYIGRCVKPIFWLKSTNLFLQCIYLEKGSKIKLCHEKYTGKKGSFKYCCKIYSNAIKILLSGRHLGRKFSHNRAPSAMFLLFSSLLWWYFIIGFWF